MPSPVYSIVTALFVSVRVVTFNVVVLLSLGEVIVVRVFVEPSVARFINVVSVYDGATDVG